MSMKTPPFTLRLGFDEVHELAKQGKIKAIYYSSQTFWWTHDPKDVDAATAIGKKQSEADHKEFQADPKIPEDVKKRHEQLYKLANKATIPKDPTGSPLMMISAPETVLEWFEVAKQKPEHFGEYGTSALMRAHHQNCENRCFSKWAFYNTAWEPLK
jgi:hypothetical protein